MSCQSDYSIGLRDEMVVDCEMMVDGEMRDVRSDGRFLDGR